MNQLSMINAFRQGIESGVFPQHLYKYRNISQVVQIIENPALYFPSRNKLNDPYEAYSNLRCEVSESDLIRYLLAQRVDAFHAIALAKNVMATPEKLSQIIAQCINFVTDRIGILSLSASPLITSMYNTYADGYKGACVEFDLIKDLETFCFPKKVEYSDSFEDIDYLKDYMDNKGRKITDALFHKTTDWEYEKEYRVIKIDGADTLRPIKPECISGIIFGKDASSDDINAIKGLCRSKGFDRIRFRQATVVPRSPVLQLIDV